MWKKRARAVFLCCSSAFLILALAASLTTTIGQKPSFRVLLMHSAWSQKKCPLWDFSWLKLRHTGILLKAKVYQSHISNKAWPNELEICKILMQYAMYYLCKFHVNEHKILCDTNIWNEKTRAKSWYYVSYELNFKGLFLKKPCEINSWIIKIRYYNMPVMDLLKERHFIRAPIHCGK